MILDTSECCAERIDILQMQFVPIESILKQCNRSEMKIPSKSWYRFFPPSISICDGRARKRKKNGTVENVDVFNLHSCPSPTNQFCLVATTKTNHNVIAAHIHRTIKYARAQHIEAQGALTCLFRKKIEQSSKTWICKHNHIIGHQMNRTLHTRSNII